MKKTILQLKSVFQMTICEIRDIRIEYSEILILVPSINFFGKKNLKVLEFNIFWGIKVIK